TACRNSHDYTYSESKKTNSNPGETGNRVQHHAGSLRRPLHIRTPSEKCRESQNPALQPRLLLFVF
ncbi:MAG: hypothetical protein JW720_07705, partial [Sedimentisphaerales bacterium]|nr:hypothetical protein [Sedimentisphaerales bacterium]